jgi:hypothetical protein
MAKEYGYGQKAAKVMELLNKGMSPKEIMNRIAVTAGYISTLKKQMVHKTEEVKTESANEVQMGGDHYKRLGVEPWDVFDTWPIEQRIGAYRANCTKYVMRLDAKDTPLLNAQKLAHYAKKLVEVLEER